MATFSERIKQIDIPLDKLVVIGSGLLDELGLRDAHDIDLVVSPDVFDRLRAGGEFTEGVKGNEPYLIKDQLEIWTSWGESAPYNDIASSAVRINGVMFINPHDLIARKKARGEQKDLRDVALLETYLKTHDTDF